MTALADIPATLTITNALDETLVIATSIRLEPLEADAVIRMAGRGRGNKSDIYQALFIAEQMGHIEAGGLSPLEDPVPSGHTLFGGQDEIGDVEPEGRAGILGIHIGAPTVGRPVLRGITALTPLGVATGAPTVGAPALLGIADLTPLGIAAGAPTVGAPVLRGVTALTPLGIATGAPTVGSPALEDIPAASGPTHFGRFTGNPSLYINGASDTFDFVGFSFAFLARFTGGNPGSNFFFYPWSATFGNGDCLPDWTGNIFTVGSMSASPPVDYTRKWTLDTGSTDWHHYAISIDKDGNVIGRKDGVQWLPTLSDGTAPANWFLRTMSPYDIASMSWHNLETNSVDVADFRMWFHSQSAADLEAQKDYNSEVLNQDYLIARYRYNERAGTVLHDDIKSHNISDVPDSIWQL